MCVHMHCLVNITYVYTVVPLLSSVDYYTQFYTTSNRSRHLIQQFKDSVSRIEELNKIVIVLFEVGVRGILYWDNLKLNSLVSNHH